MTQRLLNTRQIAFSLFLTATLALVTFRCDSQRKGYTCSLIAEIPFTLLSGGIIVVDARLDNFPDTLHLILDTGSGGISLDSATVEYFKLPKTPSQRMLRGIGSIRKITYVTDQTLHLPAMDVEHLDFHINDYTLLSSVYGVRIDGIMGFSFLSRYVVKVDYDRSLLTVYTPGTLRLPRRGLKLQPNIRGIPSFDATVGDGTVIDSRFYFDTGAGLCLLLSEDFEKDSSILIKNKKVLVTQAEGIGGKNPMKLTTVREIKIGKYAFKKVPTHVFKDEYNVTSYPSLGGLIGNDLLRRFNLIINYGEGYIHLKPNTHFSESFDYSYTGLGIYAVDGQVVIEDVLKDSPGEKAGLQPGDVIMAIDNNPSSNIQTYKNMLQTAGAKLKLLVLRDYKPLTIYLRVGSILI